MATANAAIKSLLGKLQFSKTSVSFLHLYTLHCPSLSVTPPFPLLLKPAVPLKREQQQSKKSGRKRSQQTKTLGRFPILRHTSLRGGYCYKHSFIPNTSYATFSSCSCFPPTFYSSDLADYAAECEPLKLRKVNEIKEISQYAVRQKLI